MQSFDLWMAPVVTVLAASSVTQGMRRGLRISSVLQQRTPLPAHPDQCAGNDCVDPPIGRTTTHGSSSASQRKLSFDAATPNYTNRPEATSQTES